MKVAVGSQNPVKVAAVKQAFAAYFPDEAIEYEAHAVDSGVSEQPLTIDETMTGALNRAEAAADKSFDYAVGVEGGISFHKVKGREYGLENSWVCVYDCQTGINELTNTVGCPLLPRVLKHIHAGQNLSQAMENEFGLEDLGKKEGYFGWMSNNLVTRQSITFEATYLALCALLKEEKS